jgi:hypothetical protein
LTQNSVRWKIASAYVKETIVAKLDRAILGDCGEYYAAFFLSGLGNIVTRTKRGTAAIDMNIARKAGGKKISVQVKTGQHADTHKTYKTKPENDFWVWHVGKRAKEGAHDPQWYAFVAIDGWLQGKSHPEIFFVPSSFVTRRTRQNEKLPGPEGEWFDMTEEEARLHAGLMGYRKLEKDLIG